MAEINQIERNATDLGEAILSFNKRKLKNIVDIDLIFNYKNGEESLIKTIPKVNLPQELGSVFTNQEFISTLKSIEITYIENNINKSLNNISIN